MVTEESSGRLVTDFFYFAFILLHFVVELGGHEGDDEVAFLKEVPFSQNYQNADILNICTSSP